MRLVRECVGPVASLKSAAAVKGLPRTRSGKTCRKSIADLAKDKDIKVIGYYFILRRTFMK